MLSWDTHGLRTVERKDDEVSDDIDSRETAEHPELERAYDSDRGGQVPKTRRRTASIVVPIRDEMMH
jgi:hypothetical protein